MGYNVEDQRDFEEEAANQRLMEEERESFTKFLRERNGNWPVEDPNLKPEWPKTIVVTTTYIRTFLDEKDFEEYRKLSGFDGESYAKVFYMQDYKGEVDADWPIDTVEKVAKIIAHDLQKHNYTVDDYDLEATNQYEVEVK